jgi:hypothetical protein
MSAPARCTSPAHKRLAVLAAAAPAILVVTTRDDAYAVDDPVEIRSLLLKNVTNRQDVAVGDTKEETHRSFSQYLQHRPVVLRLRDRDRPHGQDPTDAVLTHQREHACSVDIGEKGRGDVDIAGTGTKERDYSATLADGGRERGDVVHFAFNNLKQKASASEQIQKDRLFVIQRSSLLRYTRSIANPQGSWTGFEHRPQSHA